MTARAHPHDLRMVEDGDWTPRRSGMACFADICSLNMIERLARGVRSVMALNAAGRDAGVIERRPHPRCRRMTCIALGYRRDMIGALPARLHTIMAC